MSAPTDRKLLEQAAKAGGVALWPQGDAWRAYGKHYGFLLANGRVLWNPLTDAGDRYRLARTLGLNIEFADCRVWKRTPTGILQEFWGSDAAGDDDAHAIVRLAAVIGRAQ
ncbi:MAG TPA: hypothetical protein VF800_02750 [Telluria sp.]|jgi:hypothetical protein